MKQLPLFLIGLSLVLSLGACGGGGASTGAGGGASFGTIQVGVAGQEASAYKVAVDANDNVYLTGRTSGNLNGQSLLGMLDAFYTRYTNGGDLIATSLLGQGGSSVYTISYDIAVDKSDNVYITGYTNGDLGGNSLTGVNDAFLTKYDASGNIVYTKQFGVSGQNSYGQAVCVDGNGNVYITGYTTGGLDGNSQTGNIDVFIAKYDALGNKQFIRQLGAVSGMTLGKDVAVDSKGNAYITGYTSAGLDGNLQAGKNDFFLIKYDSSGNQIFAKQFGVTNADTETTAIVVGKAGNIEVAGLTDGALNGNPPTGLYDLFLASLDSDGKLQYVAQLGVANKETYALDMALDKSGNTFVSGYTTGGLDGNTSVGTRDMFLIKFDATGKKVFTRQDGVAGKDTEAWGVATDSAGNVFVTGTTQGGLDGNTVTGNIDYFLEKFDNSGAKL